MWSKKLAMAFFASSVPTFMIATPLNDLFPVGATCARDAALSALEEPRS